jgi:hypothetical protein
MRESKKLVEQRKAQLRLPEQFLMLLRRDQIAIRT